MAFRTLVTVIGQIEEGVLVKCEAYDDVQVNCSLPGVPELTMSFANTAIINDVTFHPCVRFRPWDSNQILSFVPPDGQFKLMSYRVQKLKKTPIYVKPQLTSDSGNCRVSVMVGILEAEHSTCTFTLLCFSDASLLMQTCLWTIGQIPKDKAPALSGNLRLEEGLAQLHALSTFQVRFTIMGVALSGLQIDKLDVKNTLNAPYKSFRAQTQAGKYEVRS
ncbi:AP-3 complex subunit mu [Zea mays]|uniref:AP-3 complex subunit mu n=1 Tax=Zea mays TaxID=4577 RepID=UPI0004DE9378|nr:AP-3 complex subunit mu [Zea mays]|eukprot:XP_008671093.1 AP-3 complex subunit mu [Zea mays]